MASGLKVVHFLVGAAFKQHSFCDLSLFMACVDLEGVCGVEEV